MKPTWRRVKVKGHGTFDVPPHIVRIEKFEPGYMGTRGWQVRYARPWKLFSDYAHGRTGPDASLRDALLYLRNIYRGAKPALHIRASSRKKNGLPVGITMSSSVRRARRVREFKLMTHLPRFQHKAEPISISVGTTNTMTGKRVMDAARRLLAMRRKAIAKYKSDCRRHRL